MQGDACFLSHGACLERTVEPGLSGWSAHLLVPLLLQVFRFGQHEFFSDTCACIVGGPVAGSSEAKLFTVVRIRFTAAVILTESAASLICAACNKAGKLALMSAITP